MPSYTLLDCQRVKECTRYGTRPSSTRCFHGQIGIGDDLRMVERKSPAFDDACARTAQIARLDRDEASQRLSVGIDFYEQLVAIA